MAEIKKGIFLYRNKYILFLSLILLSAAFVPAFTHGTERKTVYYKSDETRPLRITPDSSAFNLRGNVVLYHEGAVITCDSAIRYSERFMKCYGNVVINKDSTYIYGETADYNGETHIATVYAPIIKMIDGDAMLYTYELKFNTKTSTASYAISGTMQQNDNLLESSAGYYYTNTREMVCIRNVQMSSPDYKLISDSIGYNLGTEIATIFSETTIWNTKGEILNATSGTYDTKSSDYFFTSDSYILTDVQEMWSDTLHYNSVTEDAELFSNIQLHDSEHSVLGFGDHGIYWGKQQDVQFTRDPSIIYYDSERSSDSLYLKADSIFLLTGNRLTDLPTQAATRQSNTGERLRSQESISMRDTVPEIAKQERYIIKSDSLINNIESTEKESVESDSKSQQDSLVLAKFMHEEVHARFPVPPILADDSVNTAGLLTDSLSATSTSDSTYRIIRAYRDVKFFRNDFQGVCDSLFGNSIDSIIHMRIDPVMWNGLSQIKSDVVDIHTRNEQLDKAIFIDGSPIMSSEVDSVRYNQVKGRQIIAYFMDNEMNTTDVIGNAQTKFYLTDDETGEIQGLWDIESADMTFYMSEQSVDSIKWRGNPVYAIYPLSKIPSDVTEILPGFVWEISRKPLLRDVFDRDIRVSKRTHFESLPQPEFPKTESIFNHIDAMIKMNTWRERTDQITPETWDIIRRFSYDFPEASTN